MNDINLFVVESINAMSTGRVVGENYKIYDSHQFSGRQIDEEHFYILTLSNKVNNLVRYFGFASWNLPGFINIGNVIKVESNENNPFYLPGTWGYYYDIHHAIDIMGKHATFYSITPLPTPPKEDPFIPGWISMDEL